jgi:serine phosphatase RsbU (regulator of sigma subunit)
MVVEAGRRPVEAFARAAVEVASAVDLRAALGILAGATAAAIDADLVVLRVVDSTGELVARAVAPEDSALAAAVAASRAPAEVLQAGNVPEPTRRAAADARAAGVWAVPARAAGGRVVGSVEVVRIREQFDLADQAIVDLAAAQLALVVRTLGATPGRGAAGRRGRRLELAGESLAAGGDGRRAAQHAVRVAVETSGARAGAAWRLNPGSEPELIASVGAGPDTVEVRELVTAAAAGPSPVAVSRSERLPGGAGIAATLPLGRPPFAALQLFFAEERAPTEPDLAALAAFAGRAAHALRAGDRAHEVEEELTRTRALLEVVGASIARLSLTHTLETAVDRIAELLQVERVGVYLRADGRLQTAAGRSLTPGHDTVAEELFEAALGPLRARDTVRIGTRPALGVPLRLREEPIGLLVLHPGARALSESDIALLSSLAAQLAVAVQNARLHEQATELGDALAEVLDSERQASRNVTALYEISRSFAQSLSLETTLKAVATAVVDALGVDAAVVRLPDERGDQFVSHYVHVADEHLEEAVRAILGRPQARPLRRRGPMLLDVPTARRLGGAHALLVPFLEQGSTAARLPVSTPTELLAELTILSLDPARPIGAEALESAVTIAQQAALAIDNARLYQQQKAFAETMQQSLLPRDLPSVAGLDVGAVYESAAQVDVGGDVFDFLELGDGRLAVVLGDVMGHGIDATADMAMARFVFRSLAREHPSPAEFLASANEVVVDEIALGKFITMAYLTVDAGGRLECASAGHPEPRVLTPGVGVVPVRCSGLALGIDAAQTYEQVTAELPAGGAVVLYTDGVIEARSGLEQFGVERLDRTLEAHKTETAQAIADAVVASCRAFAGQDLADDCAIVVIKRQ